MLKNKSTNSVVKSAAILSLLTIVVKTVGFFKQAVISYYFGASSMMDSYLVITDFVNEIGVMFFSAIAVTFISIYDEEQKNKSKKSEFVSNAFSGLLTFAVILIFIIAAFAKPIVRILAPGFSADAINDLIIKLRWVSILLANICISNIFIAILNAEKRFGIAKSIGLIQSGCLVFACIFFAPIIGIKSLYYGFFAYYLIENIFLFVNVRKYFHFKFGNPFSDARVRKLISLSVPVFIGLAVVQINAMIDKAIASQLAAGSVSGMSYGHFIFSTIHSIFVGSTTTVLYSYFANYIVEENEGVMVEKIRNSLLLLTAILGPICLCCCINSSDIIRVIYGRGIFDENAIRITSSAFMGYAFGIVAVAVRDVYIQAIYAYKRNAIAMINGIVGVIINILLSVLLSKYIGVLGIAIADSAAYLILAILSFKSACSIMPEIKKSLTGRDIVIICVSITVSLACGILLKNFMIGSHHFIRLMVNCVAIFSVYFLMMFLFKHESITLVKYAVLKKLKQSNVHRLL